MVITDYVYIVLGIIRGCCVAEGEQKMHELRSLLVLLGSAGATALEMREVSAHRFVRVEALHFAALPRASPEPWRGPSLLA